MSLMDSMMDGVITRMPHEQREEMMFKMMPQMMDGIEISEMMPRMMAAMMERVTADDVIASMKEMLKDKERLQEFGERFRAANPMGRLMLRVDKSTLSFEETVGKLKSNALENGWSVCAERDIQEEHQQLGQPETTRGTIIYFSDQQSAGILSDDAYKRYSLMMPTGVSVYETNEGDVEISTMHMGLMGAMFGGELHDLFKDAGERYTKSLTGIIE